MRKAIAIFFLQIIVAVSVQPAIALHFCEGELSHMALYLDDGTCCEGHEKSETDCCDNGKEPIQATDALCHSVMEDHSLCCSTSTLIIETDTFQTVKSPTSLSPLLLQMSRDYMLWGDSLIVQLPKTTI